MLHSILGFFSDLVFWRNPIFIRYCRAKLRPKGFLAWSFAVLLLTGFIFSMVYLLPQRENDMTRLEAARLTLVPLFVIQCAILMFKGSFSVASGVTREGMEGVLDYQRLTPLSPVQKIVGYLFGLPVLDYCLFLLTLPFMAFTIIKGQIPLDLMVSLYSVFCTSVLLYHMTAFMAGIVVTRRFLAGFISQALMVVLYFVLPNMTGLGYVFFEYLTVRPVVYNEMTRVFPEDARPLLGVDHVDFFQFDFSVVAFSLVIQSLLFFVFAVVVYRKWRQQTLHFLGKSFTVFVYAGIMIALVGSMLPLIENGRIFPSQATRNYFDIDQSRYISAEEAALIPGLFGILTLILAMIMVGQMTPSRDKQMKGWRRAFKYGRKRIAFDDDASSSLWHTLMIVIIGAIGWCVFVRFLHASHWYEHWALGQYYWVCVTLALGIPLIYYQMALESGGWRSGFILIMLFWAIPLFLGIVLMAISDYWINAATYIIMLSGFALPYFAVQAGIEPGVVFGNPEAKNAFFHVLILYGALFPILYAKWREHHKSIRNQLLEKNTP
ncbi:hypothetical protein [Rubellicoccus peritrichatus]|uniref:Uncharacterized protein n=1 Tax=Rubellicoccus peritrichatus TaxID=3080537 RepID=A0AAQ3L8N8_9BACT|nr:hypothetical protein [Puniceicoccus sp. CR14]WOO40886.1 hypothetical protein RZN69_19860 [Puniceicoccus sp. CR14]